MIKKIISGVVIIFVFLVVIQMSLAIECDTKGNYQVCWNTISEKSSKIIYDLNIKNFNSTPKMFHVEAYFTNSNTELDFRLYQEKTITYSYDYINKTCNPIGILPNGTEQLSCMIDNETRFYTENIWEETNSLSRIITKMLNNKLLLMNASEIVNTTKTFVNVLIPPMQTRTYRLEIFDIDSLFYNGILGIRDLNTGLEYHPVINSSFYQADFTVDNATSPFMIINANVLNSSNFLFKDRGLMRYYTFDKTNISGDTVINVKDSSENVTWNGGPTVNVSAKVNEGYLLDGSDDFSDELGLDVFNTTSIIIWINATGGNTFFNGILWDLDGAQTEGLHFTTGGEIQFALPSTACAATETIGNPVNTSSFTMISYTYDNNSVGRLYINDTEVDNATEGCNPTTFRVRWGSDECCGGRKFAGIIDDTYSFNKTLTPKEISELYNNGAGVPYPLYRNGTFQSLTFNTGDNHNQFTPLFICSESHANCELNMTVEGEFFGNVSSNNTINLSADPTDGNTTFNYTVQLGGDSAFTNLSIIFNFTVPPPVIPPNVTIGNFSCLIFDDICKDGVFKCLLAVNNATGEELDSRDAFDVTCVSLNTDNVGLRFLFFAIIFILIIIGIFFKIPAIGMIGSIAGIIVSIGLFWQFPLLSVVLIFTFGAITFVQVLMIK